MRIIKEAFRKIYSGEDKLIKHTLLFILTGITSMFSETLHTISQEHSLGSISLNVAIAMSIILITMSLYFSGYFFNTLHNSFDEEKENILPEFNLANFSTFIKALPLVLVWFIYTAIILAAGFFGGGFLSVFIGPIAAIIIATLTFGVTALCIMLMLYLIYAKFAENFDAKGLFNIKVPFKYFPVAISSVLKLIVKMLPLFIVLLIIRAFCNIHTVFGTIFTAIDGYTSAIVLFVILYYIVNIYKNKIANKF